MRWDEARPPGSLLEQAACPIDPAELGLIGQPLVGTRLLARLGCVLATLGAGGLGPTSSTDRHPTVGLRGVVLVEPGAYF